MLKNQSEYTLDSLVKRKTAYTAHSAHTAQCSMSSAHTAHAAHEVHTYCFKYPLTPAGNYSFLPCLYFCCFPGDGSSVGAGKHFQVWRGPSQGQSAPVYLKNHNPAEI